jgi:hypothetical protein
LIKMRRVGRARLNAPDSKSDIGVSLSGVRIPHSPPFTSFRSSRDIQMKRDNPGKIAGYVLLASSEGQR